MYYFGGRGQVFSKEFDAKECTYLTAEHLQVQVPSVSGYYSHVRRGQVYCKAS